MKDFMDDEQNETNKGFENVVEVQEEPPTLVEPPVWIELIDDMEKFNQIALGTFAAIHAEHGEKFHLMEVVEKR